VVLLSDKHLHSFHRHHFAVYFAPRARACSSSSKLSLLRLANYKTITVFIKWATWQLLGRRFFRLMARMAIKSPTPPALIGGFTSPATTALQRPRRI